MVRVMGHDKSIQLHIHTLLLLLTNAAIDDLYGLITKLFFPSNRVIRWYKTLEIQFLSRYYDCCRVSE